MSAPAGRPCSICSHADRGDIDKRILTGESLTAIAKHYAVTADSLGRHRDKHVAEAVRTAAQRERQAGEEAHGLDLLGELRKLHRVSLSIIARAADARDLRAMAAGVREDHNTLKTMGEFLGEIDSRPQINIYQAPVFVDLRTVILQALDPYPDARLAVARALEGPQWIDRKRAGEELAHALDPVLFAKDRLGLVADEWQSRVLRSGARQLILNCSRQSGKSTITAALALHTALFHPRSLILLVSKAQRQSAELLAKVTGFMQRLDDPPEMETASVLACKLVNGSRRTSGLAWHPLSGLDRLSRHRSSCCRRPTHSSAP